MEKINAKDLRIGNLVKSFLTGEVVIVGWLVIKHIYDDNSQNAYDGRPVYEPIPLNEEWLLKFGFKKELNVHKTHTLYIKEPISLIQKDGYYSIAMHYVTVYPLRIQPIYIHQLQNLFYALTGEELTIKP